MHNKSRFLFLVPFVLLCTALLVRARSSRPQNPMDKWLRQQGESARSLGIVFASTNPHVLPPITPETSTATTLTISNRQGIRAVLRAFKTTPYLPPRRGKKRPGYFNPFPFIVTIDVDQTKGKTEHLSLSKDLGRYQLMRDSDTPLYNTNPASVYRLGEALRLAMTKARRKEPGYQMEIARPERHN